MYAIYIPLFHNSVEPRHLGHEIVVSRFMSKLSYLFPQTCLVFGMPSEFMQCKIKASSRSLVSNKDQSTDLYDKYM